MGTELLSSLNPEIASLHNKNDAVSNSLAPADFWICSERRFWREKRRTKFIQLQATMDRLLEQFNPDSVRKIMLHQEETFRDQVQELHRLYQVQKMLMAELRRQELHSTSVSSTQAASEAQSGCWGPYENQQTSQLAIRISQPSYDFCGRSDMGDDHQGQGKASSSHHGVFDLEKPAQNECITSISSFERQTASSGKMSCISFQNKRLCSVEESDIELTLSIGNGISSKSCIKTRQQNATILSIGADKEEDRREPRTNCDRESLQKRHWPFRALSLNKT